MTFRIAIGAGAVSALVAALASSGACTSPGEPPPPLVGSARADITVGSSHALCLQINVSSSGATTSRQFDVAGLSTTTFLMEDLPLGADSFTASAYAVSCAEAGTPTSQPAWVGGPVVAAVTASPPANVAIAMHPTPDGSVLVGPTFPSPSAGCPPKITEYATPTASSGPASIVTGSDGNVWFTERRGNSIGVMSPTGIPLQEGGGVIEEIGPFAAGVSAISAGSDGNLWFSDGTFGIGAISPGSALASVQEYTLGGQVVATAPGPDGNVWFAVAPGTMTAVGSGSLGSIQPATGESSIHYVSATSAPVALVGGPDGRVWFADPGTDALGAITPGTGAIQMIPTLTPGSQPRAIAVGPDGNVWFTEFAANKIGVQTPSGAPSGMTEFPIPTADSGPSAITAGPDGNVWFTEENSGRIGVISPAGGAASIREFALPTSGSAPAAITLGPDGNLWFAEAGGGNIGNITPYGVCPDSGVTFDASLDGTVGE